MIVKEGEKIKFIDTNEDFNEFVKNHTIIEVEKYMDGYLVVYEKSKKLGF